MRNPVVPPEYNKTEGKLRNPVIGRYLCRGSNSKKSAACTVMVFSVTGFQALCRPDPVLRCQLCRSR